MNIFVKLDTMTVDSLQWLTEHVSVLWWRHELRVGVAKAPRDLFVCIFSPSFEPKSLLMNELSESSNSILYNNKSQQLYVQ